ncbi:hypothetical protein ES708_29121 [subsurface metagenome]|jgi:hypothetical protein
MSSRFEDYDGVPFSDDKCHHWHWYKELLGSEERGDRYRLLKLSGATPGQARRWRDWSPNHFKQMLDYILKTI